MTTYYGQYIEPGYFETGYIFTPCPIIFSSGANRLDLRGPSSLSGTVRLLQPEEKSTGWQRFGYPSRGVIHTLAMQYNRFSANEVADLETFHTAVDASAKQFTYTDGATGNDFLCWFDTPDLTIREKGYQQYEGDIGIWSQSPFIALAAGVPVPDINAADSIITNLFNPATYKSQRKQPLTRLSDGSVCIYNKSSIKRLTRTVSMLRRTHAQLAGLIAFFTQTAQGIKNTFPWTFDSEVCTVRFASSGISWQRSSVRTSTYDIELNLEEDSAI